jgi:hypothetical protein
MIDIIILEKLDNGDIKELLEAIKEKVAEFHAHYEAKHESAIKLYEVIQLYSIKDRKQKIPYVDKRQIDMIIQLYHKLTRQEKMICNAIPYFSWR